MAKVAKARKTSRKQFDKNDANDWQTIPSKGQLYSLAIAAFEGADFPGADVLRSRVAARELIGTLKEDGFLKTQ